MLLRNIFLSFFIVLSCLLFAQDFSIGLKDGISWSSIEGRYDFANFENTQIERVTGHSFGLCLNYQLNNHFVLKSEINLEEKGFDFKTAPDLNGIGYWGNYSINYLTVPIAINYEFGSVVKYYGYTGIYLGALVKANNQTSVTSSTTSTLTIYDHSYDPTDEFNKYEFGGLVGLGMKIPLCEKINFIIDSRYNFGLTKAAKNTEYNFNPNHWTQGDPNNFQNVYNRSLIISLGVLYKLSTNNND